MLFKFLKYTSPTNYINLIRKDGTTIFPYWGSIPKEVKEQLNFDGNYKSIISSELDASWQAIQKGYIGEVSTLDFIQEIPLEDEYRFVRKYFNRIWAIYCLLIRIVSLHNPFKEYKAWSKTKYVKRSPFLMKNIQNKEWNTFNSSLIKTAPLVSVIIPTLNRYKYLNEVLKDFEKQEYKNFEIIIIDQSDNFNLDFYKKYDLNIRLIRQEKKALWLARNSAIKKAHGTFIAMSEDDVRIAPEWLTSHLKCLDFFDTDISAGVFYPEGESIPNERSFFAIAKQFATGNALLKKEVFQEIGMFDRQFERGRMGDGAFGLRCFLAGFKSISNPYASCIDVKASTGGLREMGSWDAYRPTNWFSSRPVPSVLYYYRKYYGNKLAVLQLLKTIPISILPYRFKQNKKMIYFSLIISIIVAPIILLQVVRSWYLASKKLKQGALIDEL